jgi:protease-4
MPLSDADLLVDRRRLKRQLSSWRAAALLLFVAVIAVGVGRIAGLRGSGDYIARVAVTGVIVDDPRREELLRLLHDDNRAKALIVRIDSPGGTVVGGENLFRNLRRVAEKKPVVAVMGQTAASGGYMAAVAADWIVAREGTLTGSIGVLLQTTDVTALLRKLGVEMEAIKSSPLKAVPSPFENLTEEGRRATRVVLEDTYEMFVGMVAERRKFERAKALEVADGRVFTGRQAKTIGLIDALGGEAEALDWLRKQKGISERLAVEDVKMRRDDPLWREMLSQAMALVGGKSYLTERLTLDGLVALWHPDLTSR